MGSRSKARHKSPGAATLPGRVFELTGKTTFWDKKSRQYLIGKKPPTFSEALAGALSENAHDKAQAVVVELRETLEAAGVAKPEPRAFSRMVGAKLRVRRRRADRDVERQLDDLNKLSDPRQLWLKLRGLIRTGAM